MSGALTSRPSPLSYVCDGRECIGFIFARGKLGFEAIDRDERSLGFFQTQREAATAIMRGATMNAPFQGISNAWDIFQADLNQ
jgi:hypothetical protein